MKSYDTIKLLTTKIESAGKDGISVGTGFFMKIMLKDKLTPVIVTVRHVISGAEDLYFNLHYVPTGSKQIAAVKIGCSPKWHTMGDKALCCCELAEINEKMERVVGSPAHYIALNEDNVLKETEAEKLDVLKEIVMVGYPAGVSSTPMEYPILRKGYLASVPSDNYANGGGFVDINAVGGSSGSPLFLKGESAKLIGVINATVMDNPLSSANLGIYIDAYKLLELREKDE